MDKRVLTGLLVLGATVSVAGCGNLLQAYDFNGHGGAGGGTSNGGGGDGGMGGASSTRCTPGEVSPCYSGPAKTQGVGICTAGTHTCDATGTGFDACKGEVTPAATDDCNNFVDDNCDGTVNDKCTCAPGTPRACYTGAANTLNVGTCVGGTETCNSTGTGWGPCVGQVLAAAKDDCTTSLDENCDGVVNDLCTCTPGAPQACYTGAAKTRSVGICADGTQTCNATGVGWSPCTGQVLPATKDDCSTTLDENCDGVVNDLCTCTPGSPAVACYTGAAGTKGVGTCVGGTQSCNSTGTGYGACTGQVVPAATDTCSTAADENCDGIINDGCNIPKRVFVTSTLYTGNMGGLTGADALCQTRAKAAGLSGTYKVWLSDSVNSPSTRFVRNGGPYVLVTGSTVAATWTALVGSGGLAHAINITELGTAPSLTSTSACGTTAVWSNTQGNGGIGSAGASCGSWTDSASVGSAWGNISSASMWTSWCGGGGTAATTCNSVSPIYCFEQ